jgi:hypothetical protein
MQKRFIVEHHHILNRRIKVEIVQLVHAEYGNGPIVPSGEDTNIDLDALSRDTVQRIFDIITERRAALCLPSTTGEVDA